MMILALLQAGMNLAGVTDYSTELPFNDAFRSSRPWSLRGGGELKLSPEGWPLLAPGQSAETLMLREIGGRYPSGRYVATWSGRGKVSMSRFDVTKVVKDEPGRLEVEVTAGDGGLLLEVRESDPADPVRDIRVRRGGGPEGTFNPVFLERMRPFGVLRFMDWQRTNGSPLVRWADRARPGQARWSTDAGVPVEVMLELPADPWFCIPHRADDAFVRSFAALVKEKLPAGRKVYLEYSNEVWNGMFEQARWAAEEGKRLKLSDDAFQAQLRAYSQRAVAVFRIWKELLGDRVVRVMASQSANAWVSEQVLEWKDAFKETDALAVAPYFGGDWGRPERKAELAAMDVEKLVAKLAEEVDGPNAGEIRAQAAVARKFKVALVAYEGGQHLAGVAGVENDEAVTKLFIAANRHPRMEAIYKSHLANWKAAGGGLYVAFSDVGRPGKWGSWGVLEYLDQPVGEAPKYRALVEAARR